MDWKRFNGYIFDVDGTLYSQKRVRIAMAFRLMSYYLFRPFCIKELFVLYQFRKRREYAEFKSYSIEKLCSAVGEKYHISADNVKQVVQKWMFEVPLDLIAKHRFKKVIDFINQQRNSNKMIVIYSDYPAIDKLLALDVAYDYVFISGENGLIEQKPSFIAMKHILACINLPVNELCYIGDRDDKDKASAEMMSISYCDIREFMVDI